MEWTTGMVEYWNGGILEWWNGIFFKFNIIFLHPNTPLK